MSVDTAVVPVAGHGTRLLPVTRLAAKEFLPLGRKSVIQHVAEELRDAGIRRIIFVVSPEKSSLSRLFGEIEDLSNSIRTSTVEVEHAELLFPDLKIQSVVQHRQLGLGHAILCTRNAVGNSSFVVALGDCVIGNPTGERSELLRCMIDTFASSGADAVIAFDEVPHDHVNRFGIARPRSLEDVFVIEDLIEKPSPDEAPSNLAICGRYVFNPQIFDELSSVQPGIDDEIQLTDAIAAMIHGGQLVSGVRLKEGERRFDVGDFSSYVRAFVEFAMADPQLRASVESVVNSNTRADC